MIYELTAAQLDDAFDTSWNDLTHYMHEFGMAHSDEAKHLENLLSDLRERLEDLAVKRSHLHLVKPL